MRKGLTRRSVFVDMYIQISDDEITVGKTYCYREKGFVGLVTVLSKQDDNEMFRVKLFALKYFNVNGETLFMNTFFYGYNRTLNIAISKSYFYPPEQYEPEIEKAKQFRY